MSANKNKNTDITQTKSLTIAEKFGLTYTKVGDYLIPNIALSENHNEIPLGKYGMMRKAFLKEHQKAAYGLLLCQERLYAHCHEVEEIAETRLKQALESLLTNAILPNKETDSIGWAAEMATIHSQAEEFVIHHLIYCDI